MIYPDDHISRFSYTVPRGYTVITIEQFNKYILRKEENGYN